MRTSYDSLNDAKPKSSVSTYMWGALKKQLTKLLKMDYQKIILPLKPYDLMRGKIYIEDVIETYEECPESFSLNELIVVLIDDLLQQVKRGAMSHKELAYMLLNGKQQYFKQMKSLSSTRELKKISTYLYQMEEYEELEEEEFTALEISLHESIIERGNVLLFELKPYLKNVSITFEEMLVIRYLNFLHLVVTEGNNEKVIKVILQNLGYVESD